MEEKRVIWMSVAVLGIFLSSGIFAVGNAADVHPCMRECSSDPSTHMTCAFNFTLEHYWSFSYFCKDCPNTTLDCANAGCIPLDGNKRGLAVVNKMFPGPSLRVCEGDTVVVEVKNALIAEDTAIHWHGIHMKDTPWMDGVPGLTQFPISPGNTFTYKFEVPQAGTHYWHSHNGFQRSDGIFGALVVRAPEEKELYGPGNLRLYDYDLPEHELVIHDFISELMLPFFLNHHHDSGTNKPSNILVNGRGLPHGHYDDCQKKYGLTAECKPVVPLYEVRVKQNSAYRLRLISNGGLNCPIQVSVENHTLEVIAADGVTLQNQSLESLIVYGGERFDVVLRGDQPPGSYWLKFQGLQDCDATNNGAYQLAVLNYENVPTGTVPAHQIRTWAEASPKSNGLTLNPVNTAPGVPGESMTVAQLRSVSDPDPEIIQQENADLQFYVHWDFDAIKDMRFYSDSLSTRTIRRGDELFIPQLNHIVFTGPPAPLTVVPEALLTTPTCNDQHLPSNCDSTHCECTHVLQVELGSIVELVLVDRGARFNANHPMHMHGYSFRVVAMSRVNASGITPEEVKLLDQQGKINRTRVNAPIKDTVTTPDGGYTIIRFRADNAGFWLLHCHLELHVATGMILVIQVGDTTDMVPAPSDFPICGKGKSHF